MVSSRLHLCIGFVLFVCVFVTPYQCWAEGHEEQGRSARQLFHGLKKIFTSLFPSTSSFSSSSSSYFNSINRNGEEEGTGDDSPKRESSMMSRINDSLKPMLRALENVDNVLRSTREFDLLRCVERAACEMAAPLTEGGQQASQFDLQSLSQIAGTLQQEFISGQQQQQQQQLLQQQQFFDPSLLANQQPQQQFVQQLLPQQQQLLQQQQFLPQQQFVQQQQFVPQQHLLQHQQQFLPQQFVQQTHPQFVQQQQFVPQQQFIPQQFGFGRIRRTGHEGREERERKRPNTIRGWVKRFFGGRKKRSVVQEGEREAKRRAKRGVLDTLFGGWGGKEIIGVLDRMMEGSDDSLYPYTKAVLMGYTGNTNTCETMYPDCPTNMDEVIDTFNNLRSYFPNGVPFKDRLPFPLNTILP